MTEGIVRLDSCSDLCFGRLARHGRLASFLVQILRIQSFVLPSNDLAYHSNFGLRTHTYTEGEREREIERDWCSFSIPDDTAEAAKRNNTEHTKA